MFYGRMYVEWVRALIGLLEEPMKYRAGHRTTRPGWMMEGLNRLQQVHNPIHCIVYDGAVFSGAPWRAGVSSV